MSEVPLYGPSAPTQSGRQSTFWAQRSQLGHLLGTAACDDDTYGASDESRIKTRIQTHLNHASRQSRQPRDSPEVS